MLTRRFAALSLVVVALAGCANGGGSASPTATGAGSSVPGSSAPDSSAPGSPAPGSSSAGPIAVPSLPAASAAGSQTISGTVAAGVEPHCLILRDAKGSHVLVFGDPSLRASAPVGADVTLVGRAEPRMMTTCQQGVPFVVTAIRAN